MASCFHLWDVLGKQQHGLKLCFLLELQVNYLGHYVLTRLLEDSLVAGAPSRVQLDDLYFEMPLVLVT